ncbi:MAG: DUF1553 domain-containing protein [Pedosphaera sp.]|nr:DUF1553 domain-containing protein [Pedosphaera sp.]
MRSSDIKARSRIRAAVAVVVVAALAWPSITTAADIQFNRDIRPILSDNCTACHGPDPAARKASMRLDTKEGLFGKTKKEGAVIVPGKPEESALWKRITTSDAEDVMPPPESHKELKPEQKELLKRWIAQGSPWQPHWSFIKPERSAMPDRSKSRGAGAKFNERSGIDTFVVAKLIGQGLVPNAEADRRTLARRLALDLTGLPPKPAEVEAFADDKSPDYYERYVRRLMDSPHWGEHRGRYWLDAARYADTHGLHFDNYREMWPYRDWVIRAFNRNQPFDRFVIEQIAGDLLENPTQEQLIATGFHRCNLTTNEGGTIEEENLLIYANDRVSTTGWVFLGLTANCAACHNHKFDPITQRDFYSMAAFFRNTTQSGFDGNMKDGRNAAISVITDPDEYARWTELSALAKAAKEQVEQRRIDAIPDFEKWVHVTETETFKVSTEGLDAHAALNEGSGNEASGFAKGPAKFTSAGKVEWKADGKLGRAPLIKAGATFALGNVGDYERDQAFSYGAWVKAPGGRHEAVIARMDQGHDFRGWDLFTHDREYAVHLVNHWPDNAVNVITTDNALNPGEWQHVFVTYDASSKAAGVTLFINGVQAKTRVEVDKLTDTIRNNVPVHIGQRSKDQVLDGGQVQDVRIYSRRLEAIEVKSIANDGVPQTLLAVAPEQRTDAQKQSLLNHYLTTVDQPFHRAIEYLASLGKEREAIRKKYPFTHVQQEKSNTMAMANILFRGQYDQKRDAVIAGVPAALNPLPLGAPTNRLGLAQWLVAADNPLLARVTVNRFWQEIFGVGLVKTTEDFGVMGEAPANGELLDWLAVEFRESGWDVKHLFKLMVTSSTYRQSAVATPEKLEKDPGNRLLSRGPRFRMDAEMVRDYALAASGLLVPKIGGPSVKPYQPEGVWEAVAMPESDTNKYRRDSGAALYRRSMYTFWKRAAPPASMDIFNAPSREVSCTRRERTNTPLQALATLNDPQFIEAARHLAGQALQKNSGDAIKAVEFVAEQVLTRPLNGKEMSLVTQSYGEWIDFYAHQLDEANKLIMVGESTPPEAVPAPQLAAMTMVANQLLNLDEALNK